MNHRFCNNKEKCEHYHGKTPRHEIEGDSYNAEDFFKEKVSIPYVCSFCVCFEKHNLFRKMKEVEQYEIKKERRKRKCLTRKK